ncbi:uncharacterized protein JN550_000768 [Neoarthrinium moseri]|uniref:uncharacterized protein n=1 Tax=Neoarthrinium moseri TaxID=1658444 RepID=UPI001FDB0F54|nr:uncharacterized protein JN550_000768 [Neoarthrinium moseri]KAI1876696.1 hypothetical protein JN550_000768 [Neoarthrinium moseri]
MASEDGGGILPLETLSLRAVPLTTHNIAWSPDAELAIASDDCVYLYLPEFPSKGTSATPNSLADLDTRRQYHEIGLRFPVVELRRPVLNRPLFDEVKQEFPDFEPDFGSGQSVVANVGNSLNHVVAIEWSPGGLGRMKRSVLGVLTGSGALTIYCEGISSVVGGVKIKGRNIRTIGSWVAPWSVGGNMLLPRAKGHDSPYSREYVTSFSWARDLDRNGSLLAYMNDEDEIAILVVQSKHASSGEDNDSGKWRVEEVARFSGEGPHGKGDPSDPDYSPTGSSFALKWSPWLQRPGSRTAILSYVTRNHVGFRQVTIKGGWYDMKTPEIEVQPVDCTGICLHLAPDAFVVWEDLIWTKGSSKECRGIIATPFAVESFNVGFDTTAAPETTAKHSTLDCNSTYPPQEMADQNFNPITGLVIHPPDISKTTDSPYFSLTRLSATPTNTDWYQTNLPLPPNPEDTSAKPQLIFQISEILEATQPFSLAYRHHNQGGSAASGSDAEGSEDEENEEEEEDPEDEDDEDFDYDSEEEGEEGNATLVQELNDPLDGMEKVHVNRIRIWGMSSTPGGGVTAIFITVNNAIKPERHTFAGLRCKVLFGRSTNIVDEAFLSTRKLSTEARAFEWMYGGGPRVPGVAQPNEVPAEASSKHQKLRDTLRPVAEKQVCVFCGAALTVLGNVSKCTKGHVFENCAASGLPILAPGVSNTCGICGSKCLKPDDLVAMAGDTAASAARQISSELCGGCGGKFLSQ